MKKLINWLMRMWREPSPTYKTVFLDRVENEKYVFQPGKAWRGVARPGVARRGTTRQDKARDFSGGMGK